MSTQSSIRSLDNQEQRRTPPSFWDNLSRQVLVRRALKEFDRRTPKYRPPIPPQSPSLRRARDYRGLKRFARLGGPPLADLRGYHRETNCEDRSGSSSIGNMGKTKLDAAFDRHVKDNRIHLGNIEVKPVNRAEIVVKLASLRPAAEEVNFTQEKFDRFKNSNAKASTDVTITSTVLPIISGDANVATDAITFNSLLFSHLEALTGGSLAQAESSCCDGLDPAKLDPQIRRDLGRYIMPSIKTAGPCLPNFFLQGGKNNWELARRQGGYCGTLAARGVYKLREFVDPDTALDNKAYTIVATYQGEGTLRLFTIHPAKDKDDEIAYYMTSLSAFAMDTDLESFRKGVCALRNARDWAKEQRGALADAANAKSRAALPTTL